MENVGPIPVARPLLPETARLVPYLRRIDANRFYTNHGPLVAEFEKRIGALISSPGARVVSASSGTAALIGALLAAAGRARSDRPFALIPAFTFVATAVAVETCGYRPLLADIDAGSWMMSPDQVIDHPLLDQVGVIVPVAPFGRTIDQAPWQRARLRTGIPVVIDAAASFDRILEAPERAIGDVPIAISFHATKAFGTGEGGCVITTHDGLAASTIRALNFGFLGERNSRAASINGKMSEYHAAVGLAECDSWPEKRAALQRVTDGYRERFRAAGLGDGFAGAPDIGLSYSLFICDNRREAEELRDELLAESIETRLWYGTGLKQHDYFADSATVSDLPVTERIARCVVGLPMAPDLTGPQLDAVVGTSAKAVRRR